MNGPLLKGWTRAARRLATAALTTAAAFACVAVIPACREDTPTTPDAGTGVVHGRVFDGAPLGEAGLTVVAEGLGEGDRREVRAAVADDGTYSLTVPDGPALVYLDLAPHVYHGAQGLTIFRTGADTVRVAGDTQRIDFACGRVAAEVPLAPSVRSGWWRFRLLPASDPDWAVADQQLDAAEVLAGSLRFVPPGRYVVALRSQEFGQIYLPPTFDIGQADEVEVVVGGEARLASEITGLAELEGSVTGSWQVLDMDEPEVRAYFAPEDWVSTTTDPSGLFALRLLAAGTFRLEVRIGGIGRWIGGDDFATATAYPVAPGEAVKDIVHVESGLECVFSLESLPPAYLYDVYLVDEYGINLPVNAFGGSVRVANLAAGTVSLRLSTWDRRATWLPQFWDRKPSLRTADPIVIPGGGGVAHVTATLVKGGRILGRLRDANGLVPNPSRLFALVHAADDSLRILAVYTNQDFSSGLLDIDTGDYMLTQLTDGRYRLRAHLGNDPWTWWPGRAAWDSAGVITVEDLADVTGVDWQLRR